MLENYLNTAQAADVIGCSDAHVRHMLIHGLMKGKKVSGRTWLVERKEAEKVASIDHQLGRPRKRDSQ